MSFMSALKMKFGKAPASALDTANMAAMEEREKVAAIKARAKKLADDAAAKKKVALSWSGKSYSGKVKSAVDELER